MDHQAQHMVLVNGEWVSRQFNVYQAMEYARNADSEKPQMTTEPTAREPELGILSKTVLASPVFKFVCPANIRHKDLNDLVLVGEDAVHLREIHDYGRLRHVASKTDFSGRILSARILGEPREVVRSVGSPLPKHPTRNWVKRSMTRDEDSYLPPEVVVLTLTSRTLMFLWAQNKTSGSTHFTHKTVQLPYPPKRLKRFGTFLAVDPKARAMAVAAQEGGFILYKLKNMERWREDLKNGQDTTPITDERIITLEGCLQHMEFLSPGIGGDDFHVVLLFVIVLHGSTRITCFDWDCRQDLNKATARTQRVLVDRDDNNPSLLIPLNRTSDFLLIHNTHISVHTDVLSGLPGRKRIPIDESILPSLLPGDGRYAPRWVAWDRAVRNPEFTKEVLYIAREDGRIMYFERGPAGDVATQEAGVWPFRIDTAFANVSVDNSEYAGLFPDVLVAGGIGNDGVVCKLGAWPTEYPHTTSFPGAHQLTRLESIANWTPMTDMSIESLPDSRTSQARDRPCVLISSGLSPHGEVSELRYGVQSSIDYSIEGMNGCTGLWVLDYGSQTVGVGGKSATKHWVTFVSTIPPETVVLRIVRNPLESHGEISGVWQQGSWETSQIPKDKEPINDGIMREWETITACPWSQQFCIQVTRSEARVLQRPSLRQTSSISYNSSLLIAASKPGFPVIAVTYRESGQTYLETLHILQNGTMTRKAASRQPLDLDPTCVELFDVEGIKYVFTSTFSSKMFLYGIDSNGELHPIWEEALPTEDKCQVLLENAVILSVEQRHKLVCATRNGTLWSSPFPMNDSDVAIFEWHFLRMGSISAQLRASATDPSVAFLSCGADFCRIRVSAKHNSTLDVDSIWFTHHKSPGYLQASVTAIYQLPFFKNPNTSGRNLGGFLFVVAGEHLLLSQLDSDVRWTHEHKPASPSECRIVPRKVRLGSKPTSMLFLKGHRKLVVSTMQPIERQAPPHGIRSLLSVIQLVDVHDEKLPSESEVKQEEDGENYMDSIVPIKYALDPGERVYSSAEWHFVNHQKKKYNLIIVGTGIPGANGKETGRKLILSPGKGGTKLQLQKQFLYDAPVYCVAVARDAAILSVYGRSLTLDYFDSEKGRMITEATIQLPSPGKHITVDETFVCVSTLHHSHICYEIRGDRSEKNMQFHKIFTDGKVRNCPHHLGIEMPVSPTRHLVLVTDTSSASITGLLRPDARIYKNAADTVFEAFLPHTVVRLARGNIRPPWRQPTTPSQKVQGILVDDIIGACSEGTIYSFSILDQSARRLLRYLQNLVVEKARRNPANHDTLIHPRSGAIQDILMNGTHGAQDDVIHAHPLNPVLEERTEAGPRLNHVDGDILKRWVDEDGDLVKLVSEGTHTDVLRLLGEFAAEVWGDEAQDWGREDLVKRVEVWLEEVLMPLL